MQTVVYQQSVIERFQKKYRVSETQFHQGAPCWEWTGYVNEDGYGAFSPIRGKIVIAHRVAYVLAKGVIPAKMVIDHLCSNRACVNPAHLEAITNRENVMRGKIGNITVTRTHCKYGHPFSGDNLFLHCGKRACRECHRRRGLDSYHRKMMGDKKIPKTHAERFKAKYAVSRKLKFRGTPCWIWKSIKNKKGYAVFVVSRKQMAAHKYAFIQKYGSFIPGLELDHLCRNRDCVNPKHLELVTHQENMQRADKYQTRKTHCPQGHPYSGDNLLVSCGTRHCRACMSLRDKQYRLRNRLARATTGAK